MTSVVHVDIGVPDRTRHAGQRHRDLGAHVQKFRYRDDQPRDNHALRFVREQGKLIGVKRKAEVSPRLFDPGKSGSEHVLNRYRLGIMHCTALHVFSHQRLKNPNGKKLAQTRALVASGCFAGAVDSASAIHRFQNIMVNGASS